MQARVFDEDWSANLLKCFDTLVMNKCGYVNRLDLVDLIVHRYDLDVDSCHNVFHLLDLEGVSREES